MRIGRRTLVHRHHLLSVFSSMAIMLLFGSANPCAAQSRTDDFLPLSVGNQWTYKYLTSSAEYLGDMLYSDSGVVAYTVVSKTETADSILWGFTETRNIVEGSTHTYPPQYSKKDTIIDTTKFSLIEYKSGSHRLVRAGMRDWKSVFSFDEEFADSGAFFRYYPRVVTDTFTTTFAAPADDPFKYKFVTVFFRRYKGIVRSWYSDRVTGSFGRTNHTLLSVSIAVPSDDSLRREYFPLHKGDIWQYATAVPLQPALKLVPQIVTVVDTLLPNGYRYAGLSYTNAPDKIFKFVRVDSLLRVQEYRPELGDTCGGKNELNTFRLGEKDSAFWSVCSKMGMTYLPPKILLRFDGFSADGEYMYFTPGDPRDGGNPQWSFLSHQLRRGVGVWLQPNDADGPDTFLWGAVINGKKYGNTITAVEDHSSSQPLGFSLEQNYPNPFNPSTTIAYSVPARSHVQIRVFNAIGQHVATLVDETKAAGSYTVVWNASRMSSGIYYYQMRAGTFTKTNRMAIVK